MTNQEPLCLVVALQQHRHIAGEGGGGGCMSPLADGCCNFNFNLSLRFLDSSGELTDNSWEDKIQTCHAWWLGCMFHKQF